ncbi:MAG: outer membrane lipoprotein carrier protein LolA [Deltaproteobacteria bacterium GWC2_42_11]|nr:MAG: outer membrane lipoprotein carrier protein LolA [Deltaproteobacteria bacterium GWC2_42_11]HBO84377.1 outer membrane lipoprotein carrier protein LolA [Deltaproteobacteria bacterium]
MIKRNIFYYSSAFLLLLSLLLIPAESAETLDNILSNIQKVYDGISDMKANFVQKTTSSSLGGAQNSEGVVYFKKPGMMRWEYASPGKDIIVNNGDTIWVYQPDLGQVMVSSFSSESSPLAKHFLSGMRNIKNDFDVRLEGETPADYTLILIPRIPQPSIKKIHIIVDKKTFFVNGTSTFDPFGSVASVRFSNIKINTSLQKSLFNLEIPQGVRVVKPQ